MGKASLKLLIVGALGLSAPLGAYHQFAGAAQAHGSSCPYARAKAAAQQRAKQTSVPAASEGLPGGGSILHAVIAPQIFP